MAGRHSSTFPRYGRGDGGPGEFGRMRRRSADEAPRGAGVRIEGLDEVSLNRSVRMVERAVADYAALQENCAHYRGLAAELRRAFDDAKKHADVSARQLAEAERQQRIDRERADRAEDRLELSAQAVRDLERQLALVRAQADRLVRTIAQLMSGEGRDGSETGRAGEIDMVELLAA